MTAPTWVLSRRRVRSRVRAVASGLGLAACASCGTPPADTGVGKDHCGSSSAFVSGTVSGPEAVRATVVGQDGNRDEVQADWTTVEGAELYYELNLEYGVWKVLARVDDCESEPVGVVALACGEEVVDLTVSCR